MRRKTNLMAHVAAIVALPLALLFAVPAPNTEAATRRQNTATAASMGLMLNSVNGQLMVVGVTSNFLGLRAGDQIVAVNGRRVSTEAAFMSRLAIETKTPNLVIARNNRLQTVGLGTQVSAGATVSTRGSVSPAARGGGFMNPDLMVMTSQGVMNKEAAKRLGLEGTPINGSPEHDP